VQQQNIPIATLVDMYSRGELRLPENPAQLCLVRHPCTLDSLYRGYPSGSILMWETDEPVPTRDFAIAQDSNAFTGRKLLLDGPQRLTSLTAVINGEPVHVRGRRRPIDILFNLEYPDGPPSEVVEVESDEVSAMTPEDENRTRARTAKRVRGCRRNWLGALSSSQPQPAFAAAVDLGQRSVPQQNT
jgi:hypothetical protein